jgi:ATP synthase protein I
MSDEDDEALEGRRARLAAALESAKRQTAPSALPAAPSDNAAAAMSMGLRAGGEFVSAVVLGGAIGWGLDWLLHTKPAFTIVFFLIGVAAGVLGVIRATSPKGGKSTS